MHGLHDLRCRDGPGMRKTLQQWCEAEKMIAMCVGDVNCGEVLAARDDPAQQSLRLLDREKGVHEDGISLAADERRRICHPHQLFLAGWQITSEAGAFVSTSQLKPASVVSIAVIMVPVTICVKRGCEFQLRRERWGRHASRAWPASEPTRC